MTISVEDLLDGEPINGHILIRVDMSQVRKDLGLAPDSKLYIPHEEKFAGASNKGVVVKMASDAFGEKYQEKYGSGVNAPKVGDTLIFTPYQSNKMDKDGEYYLITDDVIKYVLRKKL